MADRDDELMGQILSFTRQAEGRRIAEGTATLKHGGGDGTSGGMETRIARLESDMEHVKKTLDRVDTGLSDVRKTVGELKVEFGRFDERIKHLPTKAYMWGQAVAIVGALGAVIALSARFTS